MGILRFGPCFVCYALLCVLSSFDIILTRKRELVTFPQLFSGCLVTVVVLWLFRTVPWVGLHCVVVIFPDHIYLRLALRSDQPLLEANSEANR